jgi:hypothetical protein
MTNLRARKCAAILALVVLSASPAAALDGEVLINQANVNAGGITPGDDPGFPATLSRTGKYKLIGNLSVAAGANGIDVTAGNVTIDLNGFRISGVDAANIGVNAPNADGLTVMNGTIEHFRSLGIVTRAFAVIQDMQISNNRSIGVRLADNGRVLRSTISENISGNVRCNSRCLIAQNVVARSALAYGIFFDASGNLVLGNVIAENHSFGITAFGVTGFGNNTLTGNNNSSGQIFGPVSAVHPNFCQPACP